MQHPGQQALFVWLCLHCLTTDVPLASFVQSVERVVQQEGTFPRHASRAALYEGETGEKSWL